MPTAAALLPKLAATVAVRWVASTSVTAVTVNACPAEPEFAEMTAIWRVPVVLNPVPTTATAVV